MRAPVFPMLSFLARGCLAVLAGVLILPAAARDAGLPPEVEAALARAKLPREALVVQVEEVGAGAPRLSHRAQAPVNPASIMKLITTYAALDLLGPAYTWATPVLADGPVRAGVLEGNLYIQGRGDPKLVVERLWLLLRRVQQLGVQEIRGDIVLDRSAFDVSPGDPAAFDGEPLRPYNVLPDALLVNYKSLVFTFLPDAAAGVARVAVEPPMERLQVDAAVPLDAVGPCDDWRGALKADFADPQRVRWMGRFALSCGERSWPVASTDPSGYNARAIEAMWRQLGGRLAGRVRDGLAPAVGTTLLAQGTSPALAEVVRDINKFSNNTMARQVFLTLGLERRGRGEMAASRAVVQDWLRERLGADADAVVLDNGSGLSREARASAGLLARLLQSAWASPVMSELMSSLPVSGVDGTMRRATSVAGLAHLKTGSLQDVAGVAGYVLGASGRRYVLVAIANHPNAAAARPAFEALVAWTIRDRR